jgi:hypothetical protein
MAFAVPVAFAQAGAGPDAARAATASEAYVPTLTFDVASIRQSAVADSYMVSGSFSPHSSSFRVTSFNAMNLLAMAYRVRWDQISGMPDWGAMFNPAKVGQRRRSTVGKVEQRSRKAGTTAYDASAPRRPLQVEGPLGDSRRPDLQSGRVEE